MGTTSVADFLGAVFVAPEDAEQHGIKGQRWGVRRSEAQLARNQEKFNKKLTKLDEEAAKKGLKRDDAPAKDANKITRPSGSSAIRELSTADLQAVVNRMNLEQQYTRLSSEISKQDAPPAKRQSKAIAFINKTVADVTMTQLTRVANAAAAVQVEAALGKTGKVTGKQIADRLTGADKQKKKKSDDK